MIVPPAEQMSKWGHFVISIFSFLEIHIITKDFCFPLDLLFPGSVAIQNPESPKRMFLKQLT